VYHSVNKILQCLGLHLPNTGDHQALMGGEQLARSGIAHDVERASRKVIACERHRAGITIGVTRDLAQNPIVPTNIGQYERRA
jgi:hypothetical protein